MPYKNPNVQREYQRTWIAARRALFFEDKVCRRCGSKEDLELDHIDPSAKWSHRIWSYSWDRIMKEVAKCQVLCRACHLEKTLEDHDNLREHRTEVAYVKYHCRCDECMRMKNVAPSESREYLTYAGATVA